MEQNNMNDFLDAYHNVMEWAALVFAVIALLIFLYHKIKVATIADLKARFDYVTENEIKTYKLVFYSLAVTVFSLINLYARSIQFDEVWFGVRAFIGFCVATLFGYVFNLILKFYYPSKLDVKLKRYRYTPRVNPKTGNKMRLLSEDEEDVHLDEGMQAEEEAFSVDYDVWYDEQTGDVKIEKYPGHLTALQCNNCGFYTMKVIREEIVKQPTDTEEGELIKHYECNYCGSIRATQFHIASNEVIDHRDPNMLRFADQRLINSIRVEIIANDGHKKNYTFQNVEQAAKFLEEFDYEKVID